MQKMMNRLCLILVLLSISASPLLSQSFQGGFSGGMNTSKVDGDGHERYGKLGLNVGFFVARNIWEEKLFWQMEVKYTSRGKYDRELDFPYGISIMDLKYIEIPLSLHYFINEKIQIEFGFAPDILLKETYRDEDGPIVPEGPSDLDFYGLTTFLGANYFLNDKLAVGTRFNYSVFPFHTFPGTAIRYRDRGFFHDVLSLNLKYYISR